MHRHHLGLLLGLFILLVTACKDEPFELESGVLGDGQLNEKLEAIRVEYGLPALGAMIVNEGTIRESAATGSRAFGFPEAVTTMDKWHLGSITKSMTATVTARLVEKGWISWSTSIADIFTESELLEIHEEYHDVTFIELYGHTSGLTEDVADVPSWELILAEGLDSTELREIWALELLAKNPSTPIGQFAYSNGGYIVAGVMLERFTGRSWEQLTQEYLFDPLDMANSGFGAPGTSGQRDNAWGHYQNNGQWIEIDPADALADNPASIGPAGTVHSTFDDVGKYLFEHIKGARGQSSFLTEGTFDTLHTPLPGSSYALGWINDNTTNAGILAHNGSNLRWFAWAWISTENDIAVLTVTNSGTTASEEAATRALQLMVERFEAM